MPSEPPPVRSHSTDIVAPTLPMNRKGDADALYESVMSVLLWTTRASWRDDTDVTL